MKATLRLVVLFSGRMAFPSEGMEHGRVVFEANISTPAIPQKGDLVQFCENHTSPLSEGKVERIRWIPKHNQSNVLEPAIDLETLNDMENDPRMRVKTLAQERQGIISRVTAPLSEDDKKFGRVRFNLAENS